MSFSWNLIEVQQRLRHLSQNQSSCREHHSRPCSRQVRNSRTHEEARSASLHSPYQSYVSILDYDLSTHFRYGCHLTLGRRSLISIRHTRVEGYGVEEVVELSVALAGVDNIQDSCKEPEEDKVPNKPQRCDYPEG